MAKIIQVKQKPNQFAKSLNQTDAKTGKTVDFTTHPNSIRIFYPRRGQNGDWVTGLSEKETEEYGKKLKKDLTATSDFWESLEMRLVNKMSEVTFNLDNPLQYIQYKCALANKFLAENVEQLKEPDFYLNDSFLYVYDPEGDVKRENVLRELRDECTALIFNMRTQKEKMFYILAKTGAVVNETWTPGILYRNLSLYLEGLKKAEQLEKYKEILTSDNEALQVEYLVNKAFGKQVTFMNGQWVFGGNSLGSSKDKVIDTFIKKPDLFILLQEEIGILL